jgi:glycosyltransferase involved in cell wall biosynthesis
MTHTIDHIKKVVFIFSGDRIKLMEDIRKGLAPDTRLYGMNHMGDELLVSSRSISASGLGRLLGFRLRHALSYFLVRSADFVIGPSIFYMLPLKKLLGSKGKFILLNMSLNRYLNDAVRKNKIIYRWSLSLLQSVDIIVSLSHVQMEELACRHGLDRAKLKYIPLGVDVGYHRPVFSGRKPYVLSVGRDNGRDYKTVIEVARGSFDKEFHLVLSRRNLRGVARIPSNVRIFTDLPMEDLKKKYQEASCLLLITHPDGYGDGSDCSGQTVLLDALASGLPVIASRKAYLDDYVRDGEDVILVDSYDPSGIIEAMKLLPEKGEKIARNARRLAETEFSTEKMGGRLADLIDSL